MGSISLSASLAAHILLRQITAEFKHSSRDLYALFLNMYSGGFTINGSSCQENDTANKMLLKFRDFHSVQYNKREQDIFLSAVPFSSVKLEKKIQTFNLQVLLCLAKDIP